MVLSLLAACLLSIAEAPKPAPQVLVTEAAVRDGKLFVQGKEFHAIAHRFTVSADGKQLYLVGTDEEPARLLCRPNGPQTRMDVRGKRIVFSPSEGTVRVEGPGTIVDAKGK